MRPQPPAVALLGESLEDVFPSEAPVAGGAPLNVACHLRAFGLRPLLVTRLGRDEGGERLMNFLQAHDLPTSGVQRDPSRPTGRVLVHAEGDRTSFEIPPAQAFDFLDAEKAAAAVAACRPAVVYFGTLAQRHEASRAAIRRAAHETGAVRVCDLNLRPPWECAEVVRVSLGCAHVLKLNAEELGDVVGALEIPTSETPARDLLATYPIRTLVVTDGAAGARRLDREIGRVVERRAPARPPARLVDAVGAGDGFAAVTILGMALGWAADVTLERACELAGALCGIRGAVPPDDSFYAPMRERWRVAA